MQVNKNSTIKLICSFGYLGHLQIRLICIVTNMVEDEKGNWWSGGPIVLVTS